MNDIGEIPKRCRDCEEFDTCPFPSLMDYLKELVHERFHGNIIIPFKDGRPGKLRREEIVDLKDESPHDDRSEERSIGHAK